MKNLIASFTLICCAGVAMAISAAPGDGDKRAECQAAKAKAAQVASECQAAKVAQVAQVASECQAAKVAQVAQVKSEQCCAAAKAQAVAQVRSQDQQQCCAAAKAQAVAQVASECQAAKAQGVAQVASSNQQCCAAASKAKAVAQVTGAPDAPQCSKTAEVKYVTYGCEISDRLARVAATSYIKFMKDLQEVNGAEGCCLDASVKTLQVLYSEENTKPLYGCDVSDRLAKTVAVGYVTFMGELKSVAGYEGCAYDASMKTLAAVVQDTIAEAQVSSEVDVEVAVEVETNTEVSFGAVRETKGCGPDCTKACCTS